jgi:elongation factor G
MHAYLEFLNFLLQVSQPPEELKVKSYSTTDIRNLCVIGHGSAGKTTLSEAVLFASGAINRMGTIDAGNTVSDSYADEIERRISISSALMFVEWNDVKINIIDTPGYQDFVGEVVSAVRVVETALVVVSAQSGVEVGTERTWSVADDAGCARAVVVSRMDREHADFDKAISELKELYGTKVVPAALPIGAGPAFKGVVDLLSRKAYVYDGSTPGQADIPSEMADAVDEARLALMESAAESDDEILAKYFENGELTDEEFATALSSGIKGGSVVPVYPVGSGSAIGVHLLLDHVAGYFPSPVDVDPIHAVLDNGGDVEVKHDDPTAAFVYKTVVEPHVGEMTLLRAFAGEVKTGQELRNTKRRSGERVSQMFFLRGKTRTDTSSIPAGDIGAAVKLKATRTSDTLCDPSRVLVFPDIKFPTPVAREAVLPKAKGDEDKLATAIGRLSEEDPTLNRVSESELRQMILEGQGELHLEVALGRMKERYGVEAELSQPRIPYRETIRKSAEVQGKYKKQTGGRGQYGDCWLRIEPRQRGEGFEFLNKIVGGVIPGKFVPAVQKGVVEAMSGGVVAGCQVVDVGVAVYDGSHHSVDSSEMAFKIAASIGFKKGFLECDPILLEPIYKVDVTCPEESMGDVMGDLSSRRGKVTGVDSVGRSQVVRALVPLAELYKYSATLRSITGGRGLHVQEFSHYEEVPHDVQEKVVAAYKAAREEGK